MGTKAMLLGTLEVQAAPSSFQPRGQELVVAQLLTGGTLCLRIFGLLLSVDLSRAITIGTV